MDCYATWSGEGDDTFSGRERSDFIWVNLVFLDVANRSHPGVMLPEEHLSDLLRVLLRALSAQTFCKGFACHWVVAAHDDLDICVCENDVAKFGADLF